MKEGAKVVITIPLHVASNKPISEGGAPREFKEKEAELFGRFAAHACDVSDGGPMVYRVTFWKPGHPWSGGSATGMRAFETMEDAREYARAADAALGERDISKLRQWCLDRNAELPIRLRYAK